MNIAEIKAGPSGAMVIEPGLTATVTKVMDRKTGVGQNGEWSLQGVSLKDATGDINVTVWNKPDLKDLINKTITIAASNDGNGWHGLQVEDKSYNNRNGQLVHARQLKASGKFTLRVMEQESQPSSDPKQPAYRKPTWDEYCIVARRAHELASELEQDGDGVAIDDRSYARIKFVNTVMMAFTHGDFSFDFGPTINIDDDIPF